MTPPEDKGAPQRQSMSVWIVPVFANDVEIQSTVALLHRRSRASSTITVTGLRELLDLHRPGAAIVQGGKISTPLMDAQRWLHEFRVPTMVLVQDLTDYYEAALLDRGAQDVIGLPTSSRRLGSRLEVLIRDKQASTGIAPLNVLPLGQLVVDSEMRSAMVGAQRLDLTRSEFDLLLALTHRTGGVVTRKELSLALGDDQTGPRALESHISRMRIKLRQSGAPHLVETVRGVGYRFAPPRVGDARGASNLRSDPAADEGFEPSPL